METANSIAFSKHIITTSSSNAFYNCSLKVTERIGRDDRIYKMHPCISPLLHPTMGSALRASLQLFKFDPVEFVRSAINRLFNFAPGKISHQKTAVKKGSDRQGWWKCNNIDRINFCLPFFMNPIFIKTWAP